MNLPSYSPEQFVNREDEINSILEKIYLLANGQLHRPNDRVMHIAGHAGIGKTWLLQEIMKLLNEQNNTVSFFINLENFSSQNVLSINIHLLLNSIAEELAEQQSYPPALLNEDSDTYTTTTELVEWILETLDQITQEKILIFLFDDIGSLNPDFSAELERRLLGYLPRYPGILTIFAGRFPEHRWVNYALRPSTDNTLLLGPFDLRRTEEQLEVQLPASKELSTEIFRLSNGAPGYNYKIGDRVTGGLKQISESDRLASVKACNEDLVNALSADLYQYLKALSVLKRFIDEGEMAPILEFVSGTQWNDRKCIDLRNRMSETYVGPGPLVRWDRGLKAYVVEPQIKWMVELELYLEDEHLWRQLHQVAFEIFDGYAEEFGSQTYRELAEFHESEFKNGRFQFD